jgi:DNA-binding GntR family transcriptional regulator
VSKRLSTSARSQTKTRARRRVVQLSDEAIYREIFDAIVEHRLAPGTKLGEDELGRLFGVSRTRMRPILRQLARQKIVVVEPRRGAFVARPSVDEARAINEARQMIEDGIMRQVAGRLKAKQVQALRNNLSEERRARMRGDMARAQALTGEFHLLIASFTGNEVIVETLRDLISRDALAVALYQQGDTHPCSLRGHEAVIDALAKGDADVAIAAMREHLQEVQRNLKQVEREPRGPLQNAFAHIAERAKDRPVEQRARPA